MELPVRFQFLVGRQISDCAHLDVVGAKRDIFKSCHRLVLCGSPNDVVVVFVGELNHCLAIEEDSGGVVNRQQQNRSLRVVCGSPSGPINSAKRIGSEGSWSPLGGGVRRKQLAEKGEKTKNKDRVIEYKKRRFMHSPPNRLPFYTSTRPTNNLPDRHAAPRRDEKAV